MVGEKGSFNNVHCNKVLERNFTKLCCQYFSCWSFAEAMARRTIATLLIKAIRGKSVRTKNVWKKGGKCESTSSFCELLNHVLHVWKCLTSTWGTVSLSSICSLFNNLRNRYQYTTLSGNLKLTSLKFKIGY